MCWVGRGLGVQSPFSFVEITAPPIELGSVYLGSSEGLDYARVRFWFGKDVMIRAHYSEGLILREGTPVL